MKTARACVVLLIAVFVLACSNKGPSPEVQAEGEAREAFARATALDAGARGALLVASRPDVLFEEGFSIVSYDPPNDYRNPAFRWMGQRGHVRLRGHADRPMTLKLTGWLHEKVIRTKAVVTLYLDGQLLHEVGAVENGHWWATVAVPPRMLHGSAWADLIIAVSAVSFHWSDPPALQVVVLSTLEWLETP